MNTLSLWCEGRASCCAPPFTHHALRQILAKLVTQHGAAASLHATRAVLDVSSSPLAVCNCHEQLSARMALPSSRQAIARWCTCCVPTMQWLASSFTPWSALATRSRCAYAGGMSRCKWMSPRAPSRAMPYQRIDDVETTYHQIYRAVKREAPLLTTRYAVEGIGCERRVSTNPRMSKSLVTRKG